MKIKKESESKKTPYPVSAIYAAIFVAFVYLFWPNVYPWKFTHFWYNTGNLNIWLYEVRYWYIAMASFTIFIFVFNTPRRDKLIQRRPSEYLKQGFVISLFAGVFEEISFRWIFFYSAIAGAVFMNWLFLGFIDINIVQWFYETVLWPTANFFTGKYLEPYVGLMHWSIAAGIISANVKFRDGHLYQGFIGWTHSWFAGMILFYIMFKYGLVAAMTIHFLYDMMLFTLDSLLVLMYHTVYGKPQKAPSSLKDYIRQAMYEADLKRNRAK